MIATTTPIGEGSPIQEGSVTVCDVCQARYVLPVHKETGLAALPSGWVTVRRDSTTWHFCPSCWRVASERLNGRKGANQ